MGFANKTGLGCGAGTPLKRRMRALVLAVCLLALAGIALFRARQVYVSDGKRWCSLRVCLSGLPVLSVHTSHSEPAELNYEMRERNYGDVTLFWPEGNFRQQVLSSKVEWHWRGNASLLSQKKSYRLNLLDEAG